MTLAHTGADQSQQMRLALSTRPFANRADPYVRPARGMGSEPDTIRWLPRLPAWGQVESRG